MKAEFCTPLSVSLLPCYPIGFGSVQLKKMPDTMSLRALEIMVDHWLLKYRYLLEAFGAEKNCFLG